MGRRIRNITEDTLEIPLLGVRIAPGDVANVPGDLDGIVFPENYFEVDGPNDGGQDAATNSGEVRHITVGDSASADEGVTQ